ncbi:hypothetical protein [Glycomyces harbinensis]|uniref:Uncharacterized protein n=1 Tax=Glycomyces harbinensis TaxID=58114 RepID=A0A1G6VV42_9ACTN|nr:hypothetical protein [Glycomyces harbinensis]SDD57451.1 hypothetical protein SAMN05216270_105146 [Glycomyces harbinensis]
MSQQRPGDAEAEVGRVLHQASGGYPDLPDAVAHRLDRVLESLPAAGHLHGAPAEPPAREGLLERWAERLRPKRVRYAILSTAAAVLVTVAGVGIALEFVAAPDGDAGSSAAQDLDAGEDHADEEAAPEAETGDDEAMSGETRMPEDELDGLISDVETFATGSDYDADTDLLEAMRSLGDAGTDGEIPAELADLAAGGDFWHRCEEAINAEYGSLLLAVDFARYESRPAMVVLLASDAGETAVALTPACGDGVIEALAVQP